MLSKDQLNNIEQDLRIRSLPFYMSKKIVNLSIFTTLFFFVFLSILSIVLKNVWPFTIAVGLFICGIFIASVFIMLTFTTPEFDKLKNISSLYEEIKDTENYKLSQVKFLMKYESYKNNEFFDKYDSNDKILSEVERLFDGELNKFKSKFPLTKKICGLNLRKPLEFEDNFISV